MGVSPPVTRPLISVAEASPANKRLQAASVASASSRTVFRESTLTLPHETHLPLALRSGMDRSQMAEERVWGTYRVSQSDSSCVLRQPSNREISIRSARDAMGVGKIAGENRPTHNRSWTPSPSRIERQQLFQAGLALCCSLARRVTTMISLLVRENSLRSQSPNQSMAARPASATGETGV